MPPGQLLHTGRPVFFPLAATLCCLLGFVGWPAAQGRETPAAATGAAALAEYATRARAVVHADRLRKSGRRIEIVKVTRPVYVWRLELGYYTEPESARSMQAALKKKGVREATIRRTIAGYAVSVGEFADRTKLDRHRQRLRDLGYRNIRTVSFARMRNFYRLVEIPLPPSAPASRAPQPGPAAMSEDGGQPPPGQAVRYEFRSHKQAEDKARKLREQGQRVVTRAVRERLRLKMLLLRVYQQWSDAKKVAGRLQRHGIDARVVNDRVERGYAVSAGAFSSDKNLRRRYRQIRKIGYKSVSIVPVRVTLTKYVVEATAPRPSAAAAPKAARVEPEKQVLVFGDTADVLPQYDAGLASGPEKEAKKFRVRLDDARIEAGRLTRSSQGVDSSDYLHGAFSARWRPNEHWEYRVAGRVDGYVQTGTPDFDDVKLDYGDSFIRYRGDEFRVTAGTQTVIWGRVDEIPPTDRLSAQDLTRFVLDDLQDRRRAVPMLRIEGFRNAYKLDLLWAPDFRPAELPDINSIWSPVDRINGRLIGVRSSPLVAPLIKNGTFGEDKRGQGGYGLRISRTGRGFDYAVTLQRARQSLPYYELDASARSVLLLTGNPAAALAAAGGDTFVARHPMSSVFGGDLGFEAKGATWRLEAAYLSDVPVTATDLRMLTVKGVDWVAGVEFYPGDANARVNLQLAGHHLLDTPAILDRNNIYTFNGSLENMFAYNRWRAKLRFSVGLDERDLYLNPELAYIGWEPNEFYLGMHYFDGADGTPGGFHKDHSLIVLGWRARY